MKYLSKEVLLQKINTCFSNEISENRIRFWFKMFGHDIVYSEAYNEENNIHNNEDLNNKEEKLNEETNKND